MFASKGALYFTIILALVLVCGCSDDDDNPAGPTLSQITEAIGPEGGTIEIAGKISLTIPAGSLTDTIDFAIMEDASPPSPGTGMKYVTPVFSLTPSATDFNPPATLTIAYDPSQLGNFPEGLLGFCTQTVLGWTNLVCTQDTVANTLSAQISHLSKYAVLLDTTVETTEGVFVELVVARGIVYYGMGEPFRTDNIIARFDSTYAPCEIVHPLQAGTVTCNQYTLAWDNVTSTHLYSDPLNPFIQLDSSYEFSVTANAYVPGLTASIDFPSHEPYITFPLMDDAVSAASGFTVTWTGQGSGTVELIIIDGSGNNLYFQETSNDGSHAITAGDLSGVSAGMYTLVMNHYNRTLIAAEGYDSRGFIAARVTSTTMFTIQ